MLPFYFHCHVSFSINSYPLQEFVHWSIASQVQRLNIGPCADAVTRSYKVATKTEHIELVHIIDYLMLGNAGPEFPDGLYFSPKLGSLPIPTGKAKDFVVQRTRRFRAVALPGSLSRVSLCTPLGQVGTAATLIADYDLFAPLMFNDYLMQNCRQILQVITPSATSRAVFKRMRGAIVTAVRNLHPALLSFTYGDEDELTAVLETVLFIFFGSKTGEFVFI